MDYVAVYLLAWMVWGVLFRWRWKAIQYEQPRRCAICGKKVK